MDLSCTSIIRDTERKVYHSTLCRENPMPNDAPRTLPFFRNAIPRWVSSKKFLSYGPPFGDCERGCIRRGRHNESTNSLSFGSYAAVTSRVALPFVPTTSIKPETATVPRGSSNL